MLSSVNDKVSSLSSTLAPSATPLLNQTDSIEINASLQKALLVLGTSDEALQLKQQLHGNNNGSDGDSSIVMTPITNRKKQYFTPGK